MRQFFALVILSLILTSCDDGDVITVNFDFEDTFQVEECEDLVLYKIKNDPSESLSLSLNGLSISQLLEFDEVLTDVSESKETTRTINGSSNKFNYRRYNGTITGSELFCNAIPPDLDIISDDESPTGLVIITTTVIEDDEDGVSTEIEDDNADGDNNPVTNPTDTDNDGLADFLDADDDGDNVLTIDEDINQDGDPTNDDSDGDTIPDYLDTDDDGDGVLTRDEENFVQDQNPMNDETNSGEGPDYLNPNVSTTVTAVAFRTHNVVRDFTIQVDLEEINLSFLTQQEYDFGSIELTESTTRDVTFN